MLFFCGDLLNVASLSGLTQQWEAQPAPPVLPAQKPGRTAADPGASQSRKCGLLAPSQRDKWLQRQHCSKLVNMNRVGCLLLTFIWLVVLVRKKSRERQRGGVHGVKLTADPGRILFYFWCLFILKSVSVI